jgi:hypothetical protein
VRIPYQINLLGLAFVVLAATVVVSKLDSKIVPNLATRAEITVSGRAPGSPDPKLLVDGDIFQLGFQSQRQHRPWVQLDLSQEQVVHTISVYNRTVQCTPITLPLSCMDPGVPFVVQLSHDGETFDTVASRSTPFSLWKIKLGERGARYVRLLVQTTATLSLNELEIR